MSNVLTEGTRVRITARSKCGDAELDRQAGVLGFHYDVYDYAPPGQGDDPNGKPYYLLDDDYTYGGSHWAYPEHVEVVMTVEQKAARKPPSVVEIRNAVASEVIGMHRAIDADEVDYDGDDAMVVCGRTTDDLRVAFRIRIDEVEIVDP